MRASPQELSDGFLSLIGGMHSGIDPMVLPADSGVYAKGVNVVAREGIIQTRPSFVSFKQLANGKFQGAFVWKLESVDRLVYVIDGSVYSMRMDTKAITNHGFLFDPDVDRVYFCQAYRFVVIQDGVSTPQALEEDASGNAVVYIRTATYTTTDDPPAELCLVPGTVMAYAHGRIHYVSSSLPALSPETDDEDPDSLNAVPAIVDITGRASFVSSDIVDIYVPEFVFRMSEHRVLNEGGAIELPQELGFIHGMAAMRNAATGTGTGPLVVIARDGVCAFDVSASRANWKNIQIGQVLFSTIGTISPHSLTQINTDIGFIDTEGKLRSIKFESSNVANTLTSLPMSHELDEFHKRDSAPELPSVSMNFVDSRLTWTLLGDTGPVYKALASLDFAKIYNMGGSAANPAYDGIWTGFDFQQTLSARDSDRAWRHFVVIKNDDENHVFVLDENAVMDNGNTPIQSMIWTRYMDFGAAIDTKALDEVQLWLSGIETDSTVSVYFRGRGNPNWTLISSRTFNVPGGEPQVRRAVSFPVTQDGIGCEPVSEELVNIATHIQFAIVWTGRLKIDRFRASASLRIEPPSSCLDEDNPNDVEITVTSELDDLAYQVF